MEQLLPIIVKRLREKINGFKSVNIIFCNDHNYIRSIDKIPLRMLDHNFFFGWFKKTLVFSSIEHVDF